MKKLTTSLLALLMGLQVACSSTPVPNAPQPPATSANTATDPAGSKESSSEQKADPSAILDIEVDKNILDVKLTLPSSLFEGQTPEDVIATAKKHGAQAVANPDGSYTYTMTKADHAKMMSEMSDQFNQAVSEIVTDGNAPSIKDIQHNDGFSKFSVTVDKDKYENSFDGISLLALGFYGASYQTFNGVASGEAKVTIELKDETTGEIFDTVEYPEKQSYLIAAGEFTHT